MKKTNHLPRALVVITIVSILLWLPLFMNYYGLMEADFLATNLSFENTDLDILPGRPKIPIMVMGVRYSFCPMDEPSV